MPKEIDRTLEGLRAHATLTAAGCLIWGGRKNGQGYAAVQRTRRHPPALVHRLVYALSSGIELSDIPATRCVRHTCDTRDCINPSHLVLGTWGDNVRDAVERGRHAVAFREVEGKIVGTCRNGHDLAVVGAYDYGVIKTGYRFRTCHQCKKDTANRYYHRRKKYARI